MNLSLASFLYTLQGGTTYALKAVEDGSDWVQSSVAKIAQKTDSSFHYLKMNAGNAIHSTVYDSAGNPLKVLQDGSDWLLASISKVAQKADSSFQYLMMNDGGSIKSTLYDRQGNPIALPVGVTDAGLWIAEFLMNVADSPDLLVDGSGTPVSFSLNADPDDDIALNAIVMVLVSNSLTFGTDDFGAINELTNGCSITVKSNGNEGELCSLKRNEDFLHNATPGGFNLVISNKDVISSIISLGGGIVLKAGTDDNVTVTIQDDIDSAGDYFRINVQGVKEA